MPANTPLCVLFFFGGGEAFSLLGDGRCAVEAERVDALGGFFAADAIFFFWDALAEERVGFFLDDVAMKLIPPNCMVYHGMRKS